MELLECIALAAVLFLPFMPVLYALMLTVAESIITTVQNWND